MIFELIRRYDEAQEQTGSHFDDSVLNHFKYGERVILFAIIAFRFLNIILCCFLIMGVLLVSMKEMNPFLSHGLPLIFVSCFGYATGGFLKRLIHPSVPPINPPQLPSEISKKNLQRIGLVLLTAAAFYLLIQSWLIEVELDNSLRLANDISDMAWLSLVIGALNSFKMLMPRGRDYLEETPGALARLAVGAIAFCAIWHALLALKL